MARTPMDFFNGAVLYNNVDLYGQLNVCSSGTDSFAGWEAPNKAFKDLNMIAKDNCQLTEAWAKIFKGGCVPGAENTSVTLGRNSTDPVYKDVVRNLCSTCGTNYAGSCLTPAEAKGSQKNYDLYYGDVGALRCLARRKGDVAFLRSTALQTMLTLKEMGDKDFRTLQPSNFILLCPDGKTKKRFSADAFSSCSLGKMPDRWMVSRANVDKKQLLRWQDLWIIGYNRARTSYDWLKTYVRKSDHILDLIFTNTTEKFKRFPLASVEEGFYHQVAYDDWNSPFGCSGARIFSRASFVAVIMSIIAAVVFS